MRYIIEISYIGTNYHGWQIQPNGNSIQEELQKALSTILGERISINGSSRTDTGVHARQQYAHFDINDSLQNLEKLITRINKFLPKDIAILNFYKVFSFCHSRFDAESRKYIYRISRIKDPFNFAISATYFQKLDLHLMNSASKLLLNHQDFQCFSKVKTEVKTFLCNIEEACWIENNGKIEFHIKANRFLRGMVRAIVGSLLEVGLGKKNYFDFEKIILSKNRNNAGMAVKAEGLTLEEVNYPKGYFENFFEIKKAESGDIEEIKALFLEYEKFLGISLCFQNFEKELNSLPDPYNEPNGSILIAKIKNEIVGVVALKQLDEKNCEMKRLYVKPDFHGFGIGKALAIEILKIAKEKKYYSMKLDTLERLSSAVILYKILGFIETKPYNFNPEMDILYFEKKL